MDISEVHQELMQSIPKEARTETDRGCFLYYAVIKFLNKPSRPLNLPLLVSLINWGLCGAHMLSSDEIKAERLKHLGYISLEALSVLLQKNDEWSLGIAWKLVIKKCLSLLLTKAEESEFVFVPSESLMNFVLELMRNANRCPDRSLRNNMFCIVNIWPKGFLQDADVGRRITTTLTSIEIDIERGQLVPNQQYHDSCLAFAGVVKKLLSYGHLDTVVKSATNQLKTLEVGLEARWFSNILNYANNCIGQAVNWSKVNNPVEMILALKSSILLMRPIFESQLMDFYRLPGIAYFVVRNLLNLLDYTVEFFPKMTSAEGRKCLTDVDHLFDIVTRQSVDGHDVVYLMHRLGVDRLKKAITYCKSMNLELKHVPDPLEKVSENCPVEFMDSIYKIPIPMVTPIKLKSKDMVMDEASFLMLKLRNSPITQTYIRLPSLKKRIGDWSNDKTATKKAKYDVHDRI